MATKFEILSLYRGQTISTSIASNVKVNYELPPKKGIKFDIYAKKFKQTVPYTAQARIVYDDGSSKVVTDSGVLNNVKVHNFQVNGGVLFDL